MSVWQTPSLLLVPVFPRFRPLYISFRTRKIVKVSLVSSHHAPYELVQTPLKEFVSDAGASLVFDWCKRVLDDYLLIILATPFLNNLVT